MISLLVSLAVLIVGYFVYGRIAEKIFAPDDRQTPAIAIRTNFQTTLSPSSSFAIGIANIARPTPNQPICVRAIMALGR